MKLEWNPVTNQLESVLIPTPAHSAQVGGNHYSKLKIQPIDYIVANNIPYREGNVIKYTTRWRDKGGIESLKKAIHYLQMLIEEEEAKNAQDPN